MMRILVSILLVGGAIGRHHRGAKLNPAGEIDQFSSLTLNLKGVEELSGLYADGETYQSYDTFLPKCLERLHSVVKIADKNYADKERKAVLKEECMKTKYFLESGVTYSEKEKQCTIFAEDINAAREKELDTGSHKGYEDYCQAYYKHRTAGKDMPTKVKASEPKDKKKSGAMSFTTSVVALTASLVALFQ
jgi:hypothetical protein